MELNNIGRRLAFVRFLGGLTASGLGRLAGLSHATVSRIENGDGVDPQASVLGRISKVTGVPTDWFINGTGDLPAEDSVRRAISEAQASLDGAA